MEPLSHAPHHQTPHLLHSERIMHRDLKAMNVLLDHKLKAKLTSQLDIATILQLKNICSDIESSIRTNKKEFIVSESTPVIVKINEFAPSSIDILVRCFTKTNDYNKFIKAKDGLAVEIKKIIEKRKCSFAFPSQSLYIEK